MIAKHLRAERLGGWTILISGEKSPLLFVSSTLARYFQIRFRVYKTIIEAEEFLDKLVEATARF